MNDKTYPYEKRKTPKFIWIMLVVNLIGFVLVMASSLYRDYPKTTNGQRDAMQVAADFTEALASKDYRAARSILSPITQRYMTTPNDLGANCSICRPLHGTWESYDPEKRTAYGTAFFDTEDGNTIELPVEVTLVWLRGEFRIVGADFGNDDISRMNFLFCCDDKNFFDWTYVLTNKITTKFEN